MIMNSQQKYKNSYIGRMANAISQLGHCLSGGAADVSISGKTGYNILIKESKYWHFLRLVIDFTFKPIDGDNHCENAYTIDKHENYPIGEGVFQTAVCTLFVLSLCPLIAVITHFLQFIKYTIFVIKD